MGRWIERNTPIGVGIVGDDDSRGSEGQRGVFAGLVVNEEPLLTHVGDLDDLALPELVQDDASLVVGAEADRLTVAQLDEHVGARLLRGDPLERAVVEDVAVLVDLDERAALVLGGRGNA